MKVYYCSYDSGLYTEEEVREKLELEVLDNELYLDFLNKLSPVEIFSLLTEKAKAEIIDNAINYELFESGEYLWRDFEGDN